MIYNTSDPEILKFYQLYQEINRITSLITQAKQHLENQNLTRNTPSYTVLTNDKATYNNFKKVFNIVFHEMLKDEEQAINNLIFLHHFLSQFMLFDGQLYKKIFIKEMNINIKSFKNTHNHNLFNLSFFHELKQKLKLFLKYKLENKEIEPLNLIV